jgi:hypothetical protein
VRLHRDHADWPPKQNRFEIPPEQATDAAIREMHTGGLLLEGGHTREQLQAMPADELVRLNREHLERRARGVEYEKRLAEIRDLSEEKRVKLPAAEVERLRAQARKAEEAEEIHRDIETEQRKRGEDAAYESLERMFDRGSDVSGLGRLPRTVGGHGQETPRA